MDFSIFLLILVLPVVFTQESSSSLNNYFYNKCRVNSPNTPAYDTLIVSEILAEI